MTDLNDLNEMLFGPDHEYAKGDKTVAKKQTLITFLLDETGSMIDRKDATISGFNEYIGTLQRKLGKKAKRVHFTLTRFNSGGVKVGDYPLMEVPLLTAANYQPESMTPLYDALGRTLTAAGQWIDGRDPVDVLVVVLTDGLENASKEYRRESIISMVDHLKQKGNWTFVFLGVDMDAWEGSINAYGSVYNSMRASGQSMRQNFYDTAIATGTYLASSQATDMPFTTETFWDDSETDDDPED